MSREIVVLPSTEGNASARSSKERPPRSIEPVPRARQTSGRVSPQLDNDLSAISWGSASDFAMKIMTNYSLEFEVVLRAVCPTF